MYETQVAKMIVFAIDPHLDNRNKSTIMYWDHIATVSLQHENYINNDT